MSKLFCYEFRLSDREQDRSLLFHTEPKKFKATLIAFKVIVIAAASLKLGFKTLVNRLKKLKLGSSVH